MSEVIIIGGGLMGMLTARELVQAGQSVTLLERNETGRESSWAGGGILSPLYPWRYVDSVTTLAAWSQQTYPAMLAEVHQHTGIDPQWTRSGLMILDEQDREQALAWGERLNQVVEWLDAKAVRHQVKHLGNNELCQRGAIWLPEVAQVRNPRLAKALRADIDCLGVEVREQCRVVGLNTEDEHIVSVETVTGELAADQVVIAGGAWSGELMPGLELPVQPVRGQMLLFKADPGLLSEILLYRDRYAIPRRDGRILVGSTLEHVGYDKGVTAEAKEDLLVAALQLLPELANARVEHHWAGLRPGTVDGVPYIGEHPYIKGVYLNTGHFRNGVVLGYASARLLADLMLDRPPPLDPTPYLPNRLIGEQ